jgi:hypothetical protein
MRQISPVRRLGALIVIGRCHTRMAEGQAFRHRISATDKD